MLRILLTILLLAVPASAARAQYTGLTVSGTSVLWVSGFPRAFGGPVYSSLYDQSFWGRSIFIGNGQGFQVISSSWPAACSGRFAINETAGAAVSITGCNPVIEFIDSGAGPDLKRWDWMLSGGEMFLSTVSDAESIIAKHLRFSRQGTMALGTTTTMSGANAWDIVLPNAHALRFSNASNTAALSAVEMDSNNDLVLGRDSSVTGDYGPFLNIGGTMKRVKQGPADSGGAGYRVLVVPN